MADLTSLFVQKEQTLTKQERKEKRAAEKEKNREKYKKLLGLDDLDDKLLSILLNPIKSRKYQYPEDKGIKVYHGTQGINARLYAKTKGDIFITTYSLPSPDYLFEMCDRLSGRMFIIANPLASKVEDRAQALVNAFPNVQVALYEKTHSKTFMTQNPPTLFIGSGNFGRSGWAEAGIRLEGYISLCIEHLDYAFKPLWLEARKMEPNNG